MSATKEIATSGTPVRRQKHIPQRYISRKHRKYGTPPLSNRERIGACACPFAVSGVQQENPGALSLNAPLGENTIPNGGPLKKIKRMKIRMKSTENQYDI